MRMALLQRDLVIFHTCLHSLQLLLICVLMCDITSIVDLQTLVRQRLKLLRSSKVRKLVEQLVVVLSASRRQQHRVQILFRLPPQDLIVKGVHLHVDKLFASLYSFRELVVEAPGHENNLN